MITIDRLKPRSNPKRAKLANLVTALRILEGLSEQEFARRLRITPQELTRIEQAKADLPESVAKQIAQMFNLDIKLLLDDK